MSVSTALESPPPAFHGGAGDLVVLHGGDVRVVELDPAGADPVHEVVLHHRVAQVVQEHAVGSVGGAALGDVVALDGDVGERRELRVTGRGAQAPAGGHGSRGVPHVLLEHDPAPRGVRDRGVLDGDAAQDRRGARRCGDVGHRGVEHDAAGVLGTVPAHGEVDAGLVLRGGAADPVVHPGDVMDVHRVDGESGQRPAVVAADVDAAEVSEVGAGAAGGGGVVGHVDAADGPVLLVPQSDGVGRGAGAGERGLGSGPVAADRDRRAGTP